MRILLLLPYSPIPPTFGGALRNYHLLKHLAQHHDVTVLTYGTPEVADSITGAASRNDPITAATITMLVHTFVIALLLAG